MTRMGLSLVLILCSFAPSGRAQASREEEASRDAAAGQQAMAHGDYATAQAYFEKLEKLEPGIAEIHATLAAIDFKQREYEQAIGEIHAAQRLKPGLPKLDSLLGLSLAEEGKFSDALPHLEKGFRQTADSDVRRMCGLELLRAYSNLDRDADAVETSLALNKAYPNDPEVLYHTGRVYGSFAYTVMEKLHDTAPGSVWMLQAQGEANESQKNWDAAMVAFNHVLAIDANRPGIHYQLGRVYLGRFRDAANAQDRETAVREFTAELALDPGNGNAAYELANLQAEAGNLEEAGQSYERLLQQYPDFEEALVGLAGVDLARQKADQAVSLLERATRLRPNDEVAWWRLAQADRATGNSEGQRRALATFQKIHTIIPGTLAPPNANEVTPQRLDPNANP
jgi:tetratricopeptide (TPR) repeat protein